MKTSIAFSDLALDAVYSYADYLSWRFQERVELIKGKLFKMSPAPSRKHQEIVTNLFRAWMPSEEQRPKNCKIYTAPFDVRLPKEKGRTAAADIYTVVQPDLSVICDPTKLDDRGCLGDPDLIVEILSKGNAQKEIRTKFDLYEESGVREYWIIFPYEEVVQQFVLTNGGYHLHQSHAGNDVLQAYIFPNFQLGLAQLFAE